ncbi:hypothetical protein Tco_0253240, partial [Tanacetum coccineum]
MGNNSKIALARFRIANLEQIIKDILVRHQADKESDHTTRFWQFLEAELQESRTQIAKLQRKQMGNNSKIALAYFRIANLEQIIKEIHVRHQADKESLLN